MAWFVKNKEIVSYEEAYEAAKKYKYFGDFCYEVSKTVMLLIREVGLKDYTWLKYKTNRNYERPKPSREECFEKC